MGKSNNNWLFFDKRDHELIHIVNSIYDVQKALGYTRKVYYTFFHPLGIKELAESKGLRTAYSIVNLLESMERGEIENRIQALNGLKDDVLTTASGPMPKNTARVLLQIMKDLIRAKGNYSRQLELAHDFRIAAFGKPTVIRKFLARYHLLEMPEEWNQITFDDHVHDANTSGRKSPTHLIMDAWIKGIRRLRVIYYHYIEPRFAAELIQAAQIMDIDLRIGIEFRARFRGKYISFIWVSRGFHSVESFLCFLAEKHVVRFMEEGKAVLKLQEEYVLNLLDDFNASHLDTMCRDIGIRIDPLEKEAFLNFVFPGQPSAVYLAEYILWLVIKAPKNHLANDTDETQPPQDLPEGFGVGKIMSEYLESSPYFDIFQHAVICSDSQIPRRLRMEFKQMIEAVKRLHHSFRITLNVGNLKPEDVLELLYDGDGVITRLETINLKNFIDRDTDHILAINDLQRAINEGSLLKLKRTVRQIIESVKLSGYIDREKRLQKLLDILYDIDSLKNMYAGNPLKSRIGSDSTGKPNQGHGMGFALIKTLPGKAQKKIKINKMHILPARIRVCRRTTLFPSSRFPFLKYLLGKRHLFHKLRTDWTFESFSLDMEKKGNIVSLGHMMRRSKNKLDPANSKIKKTAPEKSWKTLNTKLKNCIKIMAGFIPAFFCFLLTKDWWLLSCFGAVIWFGITGVRNIVQSVIGGGGFKRTSVMKWNDFISWDRLADSLFYTGFSVPLLDYVIKTVVLEKGFNITMGTSPIILYSTMALANGIYLSSHNIFRGLPRVAAAGNFFRSLLSIPFAILINSCIGAIMSITGFQAVDLTLQKWAAIISKGASDIVAGIIEGTAERFHNIRLRERDIQMKFQDLFATYSRLELLFPETEELRILEKTSPLLENRNSEIQDLTIMIIINSLDLLYFWMYLPRTKVVMADMVAKLTPEEKTIFVQSQNLLKQEKYISRLFIDGILGNNFSKPLAFYLGGNKNYLSGLSQMISWNG